MPPAAAGRDELPLELSVTVGSGLFGGWQARWDGDRLVYDRLGPGFTRDVQEELWPSASDWRRFWADVERIGVWAWRRRYDADGGDPEASWQLRLARPGRRIESEGRNGAEPDDGRGAAMPELLAALRRLLGGRAFGES